MNESTVLAPLRRAPIRASMGLALLLGCDADVTPPVDQPTLGVTPRRMTLVTWARNPDPVLASVEVFNNSSSGSLGAVSTAIRSGNAQGWLALGGFADGRVSIEASAENLAQGVYTATVDVIVDNVDNSPRMFTVTFVVGEGPEILLATDSVRFHARPTAIDLDSGFVKSVGISNGGGGTITDLTLGAVTYLAPTFDATNGDIPPTDWVVPSISPDGDSLILSIPLYPRFVTNVTCENASATRLCLLAELPIISPVAGNSPFLLDVIITFDNKPTVFLTPKGVSFAATAGSGDPMDQVVMLSQTGLVEDSTTGAPALLTDFQLGLPIDLAGTPVSWLSAELNANTVVLSATQAALSPGMYEAVVEVTHPDVWGNNPRRITDVRPDTARVTFVIDPPPPVDPFVSVDQNAIDVGENQAVTVVVTNGGDGDLTGIRVDQTPDFLLAFLSGTSVSESVPVTLTISRNPAFGSWPVGSSGAVRIVADQDAVGAEVTVTAIP